MTAPVLDAPEAPLSDRLTDAQERRLLARLSREAAKLRALRDKERVQQEHLVRLFLSAKEAGLTWPAIAKATEYSHSGLMRLRRGAMEADSAAENSSA